MVNTKAGRAGTRGICESTEGGGGMWWDVGERSGDNEGSFSVGIVRTLMVRAATESVIVWQTVRSQLIAMLRLPAFTLIN